MKKGRTAAEINFAETARIRYELELVQVWTTLGQTQAKLSQTQAELAQARAELMQVKKLWLNRAGAAELRRQLVDACAARDALARERDLAEWKKMYDQAIAGTEVERLRVHLASERRLQERLTTLADAEAALADCGIGGIYDRFSCLTDAIMQMSAHIKELTQEPVEVEITGKEMVEALQEERRERVAAERCHRASLALAQGRGERAEALAALVNEETAGLLERLSASWIGKLDDKEDARELAAKIRKVLDDSKV